LRCSTEELWGLNSPWELLLLSACRLPFLEDTDRVFIKQCT